MTAICIYCILQLMDEQIPSPIEFEWDEGNQKKTTNHKVSNEEAEEPFFDIAKKLFEDKKHSGDQEVRYVLLGQTKSQRLLYIVFTIRNDKIRVITARDINRKEVPLYEETT